MMLVWSKHHCWTSATPHLERRISSLSGVITLWVPLLVLL